MSEYSFSGDDRGWSETFEIRFEEPGDSRAALESALQAFECVASPLVVQVVVAGFDRTYNYIGDEQSPEDAWSKWVHAGLPAHVSRRTGVDLASTAVEDLSAAGILSRVEALCAPPAPDPENFRLDWSELEVTASRVRLPRETTRVALEVEDHGRGNVPVEGLGDGAFASGPVEEFWGRPPCSLSVTQDVGVYRVRLHYFWANALDEASPWHDGHQAARARLVECGFEATDA